MGRNLCRDCKNCEHKESCLLMCIDVCSVPIDLLEEIESARNTYDEACNKIQTIRDYFVNNLFTN